MSAQQNDRYGLVAEYDTPEAVLEAAHQARKAGYSKMDAYTPHPIEGLDDALGMKPTQLGFVVLGMGLLGAVAGYFMQWYSMTTFYPLNIGGRPLHDWPTYVVITFEITVLLSAFTAGLFMIGRNGLPRPYHPIFNTPGFERATRDGYFLCIEQSDPKFNEERIRELFASTGPVAVQEVSA
jgi:hypothetical protein